MNKRAAREKALEGTLSIGDLRAMITDARAFTRPMSKVNPAFPLSAVLEVYDRALDGRSDEEVPTVLRRDPYSRSGLRKPTADVLLITNILRDCSKP